MLNLDRAIASSSEGNVPPVTKFAAVFAGAADLLIVHRKPPLPKRRQPPDRRGVDVEAPRPVGLRPARGRPLKRFLVTLKDNGVIC